MIALLALCTALGQEPALRIQASQHLLVGQPEVAQRAVVDLAGEAGGWLAALERDRVEVRVPAAALPGVLEQVEQLGRVLERSYTEDDLSEALATARARLGARQELLAQYFEVLETAGPESVVTVEQQIVAAIEEIERLQGAVRLREHQVEWARLEVAVAFRDRRAPAPTGASSFGWLNRLGLSELVSSFRTDRPGGWIRRRGVAGPVPDGFSAYRTKRAVRGIAPDEVVYQVRAERHRPEADVSFWREASARRFREAGYSIVEEAAIDGPVEGFLLDLAAPLGTEDWRWLVAVYPVDGRLIIAEAAGRADRVEGRREAIVAAFRAVEP